ncbi:SDR family oxidoreductase, partial [Frankia sp. CiP3]
DTTDDERTRRAAQTLVNRVGEPGDAAAAIHYLASPDAGYVTGQFLHVNGGALPGR